ncbi:flippase-like domain-containing protein [Candidatus Saccharibacteria bacterium]|nr:flippase-like domain-containing protein [Candidatus Saccharibacteria bacterium]
MSNPRRALWFTEKIVRFLNWLVRKITLGKKRKLADYETIKSFILEIHKTYTTAKENKNILKFPILWGAIYSFFEIATYWVVSISLGHPELLPEIMIGEAVGSIAGSIIPYGLYELGMAGAIASLGVDIGLAGLIVVITRVVSLGETFLFGHIFYQASMRTKPHES